ncbi:MAG: 50S ribosomal protein L13 [Candidatus Neomarinimicrobiota bacterium]|jgi:large subunit ribosomal protein L13|nr:50S ribosomal protein L13 [Candidatus Neomarinimicrobiota bacterium]|tara:strand:+ start:1205 stop:1633 length:429 start_codon:yes stop_codon:yes gene_type:complete
MKTTSIKISDIKKEWFVVDAEGQRLGRLASNIAQVIKGKNKPYYTPHMDMGDCVIVINAEKVETTGKKESNKEYWHHTGFPGGQKSRNLANMRQNFPERIIENAVKGMLPHNRLGRKMLQHLKVYQGETHPHVGQEPKKLKF